MTVIALPGSSVPSLEPVERVVEILERALAQAREGKLTGIAVVKVCRDPQAFSIHFHGEHGSRHSLAAGVLALGYSIAKEVGEADE
jgi:hypothetical protein